MLRPRFSAAVERTRNRRHLPSHWTAMSTVPAAPHARAAGYAVGNRACRTLRCAAHPGRVRFVGLCACAAALASGVECRGLPDHHGKEGVVTPRMAGALLEALTTTTLPTLRSPRRQLPAIEGAKQALRVALSTGLLERVAARETSDRKRAISLRSISASCSKPAHCRAIANPGAFSRR
jgi:hypothetical protein